MAAGTRVAVTSASFVKSAVLLAELEATGAQLILNDSGRVFDEQQFLSFVRKAKPEVLLIGTEPLTLAVLEANPELRFVAKYGVGLDNLDPAVLESRGIGLGWTGGVNRRSVAELVLAFALGHCRKAVVGIRRLRRGEWVKDGGVQLSDLQVGIVGFGAVGTEVARLLQGFGCRTVYCDVVDRSQAARDLGVAQLPYEDLLRTSDIITLHVPATPQTLGMFGTETLLLVKPNALLINTSRGSVVAFDATCNAVVDGRLGGYAADVFPVEPCDLTPWASCDALYFTPHIGGNTREAVLAMGRSAIAHIKTYLQSC